MLGVETPQVPPLSSPVLCKLKRVRLARKIFPAKPSAPQAWLPGVTADIGRPVEATPGANPRPPPQPSAGRLHVRGDADTRYMGCPLGSFIKLFPNLGVRKSHHVDFIKI